MILPNFDKSKFSTQGYLKKVDKPWGYELHFVSEQMPYMGKLIHIHQGSRISMQIHDQKEETWFLIRGRAKIIWENKKGNIIKTIMKKDQGYSLSLGQKHRLAGITDCDIIEVSTPESGTTYRLEDDYNRPDETPQQRKKERAK